MNPILLLVLVGGSYVLLFGGLSLLRRETLSGRFAFEALIITAVFVGLSALASVSLHPVLFLLVLYLLTMRVRLLVDLANIFARQNRHTVADRFYRWAELVGPDNTSALVVQVNQSAALLQRGEPEKAAELLHAVLEEGNSAFLGVKYEAAARYNLGIAHRRMGNDARANQEFRNVLDIWPLSEYAREAEKALARGKRT